VLHLRPNDTASRTRTPDTRPRMVKLVPTTFLNPDWHSLVIFCVVPWVVAGLFLYLLRRNPAGLRGGLRLAVLNALALIFFVTFGFLVGECYYRFIYDTTDSFNYTFASKRWFARYFHYNKSDLRDNVEYSDVIPPGTRRITFLGDSFTVGQGVKNVDDRFANRLRLKHPNWDVQVLAVEGMDTGDQLQAMDRMVRHQYPMDVVVLVYCLNDVSDMMPEWRQTLDVLQKSMQDQNWLVKNSYFANTFYFRLKARSDPRVKGYFSFVRDAYQNQLWEVQQQRLAALRRMIEGGGGKLVVVTFPFMHILGPHYDFQFAHDQLGKFWQRQGVPHLDLLPMFQTQKPGTMTVNRLDAHPNEQAHALAAEVMDKVLSDLLGPGR
jgi:lysophospholipase L1-like esterase